MTKETIKPVLDIEGPLHVVYKCDKCKAEKQEPVGWIDSKGNMICTKINESCKPLYTTPQKRPWAGLTDEEVKEFAKEQYGWEDLLKAVEAKLKEKNL